MSRGFEGRPLENPNNCTDPYTPSFWLGKPGALTQIRMPDAGIRRDGNDNFAVKTLLDGQSVDRSPYLCRTWSFQHQWLRPEVMSVFMEYATRQRGIGPFILIDPQMKNLLTPNQASGTDSLHTTEGFKVDPVVYSTVIDTMSAVISGSWGTADVTGQSWTATITPNDYWKDGIVGQVRPSALNSNRHTFLTSDAYADRVVQSDLQFSAVPASGLVRHGIMGRSTGTSNYYAALLEVGNAMTPTLTLVRVISGTPTIIGSTSAVGITTVSVGLFYTIEISCIGNAIKARVWQVNTTKPLTWHLEVTDTQLPSGTVVGTVSRNETAATTHIARYDNFQSTPQVTNSIASSTDDKQQGERSLSWTISPPVTGSTSPIHLVSQTGLYGFCLPPGKVVAFSGWTKLSSTSLDPVVTATPSLVWMNGVGAVQSTVVGTSVLAVTGSSGVGWQKFCVTGIVPTGSAGVYLDPQIVLTNASIGAQVGVLLDQLQLEITATGACTDWEYGQGQPLVGVRAENEVVPRILRTDMTYTVVEVT